MLPTPTTTRFHKLIDDIFRLYVKARNAQVEFALEVGRRLNPYQSISTDMDWSDYVELLPDQKGVIFSDYSLNSVVIMSILKKMFDE